jgi:carbonic anhydrase
MIKESMPKKGLLVVAGAILALVASGCSGNNSAKDDYASTLTYARVHSYNEAVDHDHDQGWNHGNQDAWYFSTGRTQSPIDIVRSSTVAMQGAGPLLLNYPAMAEKIYDTGHDIHVIVNGTATINHRPFQLLQFHLHSPSEHTMDGKHYPLELHFVHAAQNGQLAVVGVMFEEGAENQAMGQILEALASGNTSPTALNLNALLPSDLSFYHYRGSLTTPPLTENVDWYVLANTITVSQEQLQELLSYYKDNNRNIQPINDRSILYYKGL